MGFLPPAPRVSTADRSQLVLPSVAAASDGDRPAFSSAGGDVQLAPSTSGGQPSEGVRCEVLTWQAISQDSTNDAAYLRPASWAFYSLLGGAPIPQMAVTDTGDGAFTPNTPGWFMGNVLTTVLWADQASAPAAVQLRVASGGDNIDAYGVDEIKQRAAILDDQNGYGCSEQYCVGPISSTGAPVQLGGLFTVQLYWPGYTLAPTTNIVRFDLWRIA